MIVVWIIQTIIFVVLSCILGGILILPYYLVQRKVRDILYKRGFNCYTEEEKVQFGLSEVNRITDLNSQIAVEKDFGISSAKSIDKMYNKYFPAKVTKSSKKLIEHIDGNKEVDLSEITQALKKLSKKR